MIDYANSLNEAQYAAVTSPDGPVLVVAGAGSGKTRAIVYRLVWLTEHGVPPESILLLTFTRKAAHEMLYRAGTLLKQGLAGVQGGTFHAFAYSVLRRLPPARFKGRSFTLMDAGDITAAVKHCKDDLKLGRGDRSFPKSQSIAAFLSKARNKELPITEVLEREAFHLLPHADDITKLGTAYDAYREHRCLLDYDDLLFELETLLRDDREVTRVMRQRFTHILVDEYQDTNRVQARITRLLAAGNEDDGSVGNVMAVGDEAQSIYAFRGADVRNILDFPKLFAGTRVVRLEENYRSTQPVLNVANALLANAAESYSKQLFTRKEGGEPVRLITPLSDVSQARLVTLRIQELLTVYPPHEIAVLFRAGFHSYHLEMTLHQFGIPFRKYGGLRYTEAAHVKDVIAFARLALNPLDMPAFTRVAALHAGIGPKTTQKLYATLLTDSAKGPDKVFVNYPGLLEDMRLVENLREKARPPVEIFSAILEHYFPRMEDLFPEDWPRRRQGLEEIIQMAASYAELDLFVADLALESPEEDDTDGENRIVLSTVHSAKGLEWNAVLLIDLVEDRFPSRHALARSEDFEEERRLMYVACTRARKHLDLYAPASIYNRAERGSMHVNQSPFVREIPSSLTEEWQENLGGSLARRGAKAVHRENRLPAPSLNTPATEATTCRHRIFGHGKVVRHLPPDKMQVEFPGFGTKVILTEYLLMED